jgi:hypothetical protein
MQTIKFRGRCKKSHEWVFGNLIYGVGQKEGNMYILPNRVNLTYVKHCHPLDGVEVMPETVGQFSTFLTKDGKEIYAGDDVYCLLPYRTTQTHTGDNIPNGSYTEPMEPGIKAIGGTVVFIDGCFQIEGDKGTSPMFYYQTEWCLESIKQAIEWTRQDAGWFDDPEEGDLQYLILEVAKVKDANELIEYLNGWVIEGDIHEQGTL